VNIKKPPITVVQTPDAKGKGLHIVVHQTTPPKKKSVLHHLHFAFFYKKTKKTKMVGRTEVVVEFESVPCREKADGKKNGNKTMKKFGFIGGERFFLVFRIVGVPQSR